MEPLAVRYVKSAVLFRLEREVTELKSEGYRIGSFHPIWNPKMQRLEYIQVMYRGSAPPALFNTVDMTDT